MPGQLLVENKNLMTMKERERNVYETGKADFIFRIWQQED